MKVIRFDNKAQKGVIVGMWVHGKELLECQLVPTPCILPTNLRRMSFEVGIAIEFGVCPKRVQHSKLAPKEFYIRYFWGAQLVG